MSSCITVELWCPEFRMETFVLRRKGSDKGPLAKCSAGGGTESMLRSSDRPGGRGRALGIEESFLGRGVLPRLKRLQEGTDESGPTIRFVESFCAHIKRRSC